MRIRNQKGYLKGLAAILLVVPMAIFPNILTDNEKQAWVVANYGMSAWIALWLVFIIGAILFLFLTTDIAKSLIGNSVSTSFEKFNIPPGLASRKILNQVRDAVREAKPEEALHQLYDLKLQTLKSEIDLLSSRLAEYRQTHRQGTEAPDSESRTFNQIIRDILSLTSTLENELSSGAENYDTIRAYLKKRYTNRLNQKLASRQPVNLRRLVNLDVMPEGMQPAFVSYNSGEVGGALTQTFDEAMGRLLLVGAPGAGKTTLMLQLVLELLDSKPDVLPVVLNLATWSKDYITLNTWLKKILPAEAGTSDQYAADLLKQNNLIFLFDGFDEILKDDRASCIDAINRYGEDNQRSYVLSSRIKEFKEENKGVLVGLPLEVCPLTFEQMRGELQRISLHSSQPERGAKLLLDAIEKDKLLQKAVEIPQYFNILQILFNKGLTLHDLQFKSDSVESRKAEITERFVEYEMKAHVQQTYPAEKANYWLSFLASRMLSKNKVVFELVDLQYSWWKWSRIDLVWASLLAWAGVGLLYTGQYWGSVGSGGGLVIGTIFSLFIVSKDHLILYYICGSLSIMIFPGIIGGLLGKAPPILTMNRINFLSKKTQKWILVCVFYSILVFFIIICLSLLDIPALSTFYASITNPIPLIGLFTLPFWAALINISHDRADIIQISSPYQRFDNSKKALYYSIRQHRLLLYQLHTKGVLPNDLVQFLNEMSLRHILEFDGDPATGKGGGAWRFRHRILQEYFAEKWVEPDHKE